MARHLSAGGLPSGWSLGNDKTIYAAKINSKGEATAYYTGKLGVGFKEVKALETPVEFNSITVHMIREAAMHAVK